MSDREVIRCKYCGMNQFMTANGLCRKTDCGKPLKPDGVTEDAVITPASIGWTMPIPTDTNHVSSIVKDYASVESNVRQKSRCRDTVRDTGALSIRDFPTQLRLACLEYARIHKMTLRNLVIEALKKYIDRE